MLLGAEFQTFLASSINEFFSRLDQPEQINALFVMLLAVLSFSEALFQ